MAGDIDIHALPLWSLPRETRNLLSCLLDTTKIFPSDGIIKLPRDWRGLASLVNISVEVARSIKEHSAKTSKVLDIWIQRQDGTATVGQLLDYLQQLDRYDVYDDIIQELSSKGQLMLKKPSNQVLITYTEPPEEPNEDELITYQDRPGHLQQYHAFVLYAEEDKLFVDELLMRLREAGFCMCTVDDLLPGHATQYAPASRLISRCQRIILVYSPEFLLSLTNSFYRDYAQALSIEKNQRKIIPIMYRECKLPMHLTYYHKLYYNTEERAMYDFWQKLKQSLDIVRLPGLESRQAVSTNSGLNIIEMNSNNSSYLNDSALFLPQQTRSISMSGLETMQLNSNDDSKSLGSISQTSVEKKKKSRKGPFRKILNTLTGKKYKNALMVEN